MRTIWHSLAWKEWHEHKWKLAAISAVLCGVNALLLLSWGRETLASCFWMTAVTAIPLAMFVGASAAAGEQGRRTVDFLGALPVSPRTVALTKLMMGMATLIVAVALTELFVVLWIALRQPAAPPLLDEVRWASRTLPEVIRSENWFVVSGMITMAVTVSTFLWTAAAGMNRRDEVSSAAKASLIMIACWGLLALAGLTIGDDWFEGPGRKVVAGVVTASPAGPLMSLNATELGSAWNSRFPACFAAVVYLGLGVWFVARYGNPTKSQSLWRFGNLDAEELGGWLRPPQRSPWMTIAWKQVRESMPIVVAGLGSALVISIVIAVANWRELVYRPIAIVNVFAAIVAVFSFFISIVAGVGVFLADLSPQHNAFWRSRPINPSQWFWVKALTGLAVLILTLLVPVLVVSGVAHLGGESTSWNAFFAGDHAAWIFVGMFGAIYIATMAMTALVRHAIYGAILGIAALFVGPAVALLGLIVTDKYIWPGIGAIVEPHLNEGDIVNLAVAAMTLVTLIVGWLAVRKDWGWKKG